MYSLDELKNRSIWNFRDPRSGSTWFFWSLASRLGRKPSFLDIQHDDIFGTSFNQNYYVDSQETRTAISNFFKNRNYEPFDNKCLLSTHEYTALETISKYQNPIIIRNTRKNKTEQFLSLIVANLTRKFNIHSLQQRSELPQPPSFSVEESKVLVFIDRMKEADQLWQQYASQYETEVVSYEDLMQGWTSKIFNRQFKMDADQEDEKKLPVKLRYNYEEMIINYNQIDKILKEHLDYG